MKDPSDGVVDELGLGEGLMTTLVGNNPKTSGKKSCRKAVQSPESKAGDRVQHWVGQCQCRGVDERVEEDG